jgi:hypothetical protein
VGVLANIEGYDIEIRCGDCRQPMDRMVVTVEVGGRGLEEHRTALGVDSGWRGSSAWLRRPRQASDPTVPAGLAMLASTPPPPKWRSEARVFQITERDGVRYLSRGRCRCGRRDFKERLDKILAKYDHHVAYGSGPLVHYMTPRGGRRKRLDSI